MNKEIFEGIFIRLLPGEQKRFWEIITASGYEANAGGVKKFILETDKEPVEIAERASRFLQDYPEITLALKHCGNQFLRHLKTRWRKW